MTEKRAALHISTIAATALVACVLPAAADPIAFQDLMAPDVFPEAQFGMSVESAKAHADSFRVTTTGAEVACSPEGVIHFRQLIGHRRRVAAIGLGRRVEGVRLTHSGPGFVHVSVEAPRVTIRVNGDSLALLHAHEPLTVRVRKAIDTAWSASFGPNHLIVDEWGGFGLYCSEPSLDDGFAPHGDIVATYDLPADAVLAVGVCPPKPYDWGRSLNSTVVWHWSAETAYPPDSVLRSWRPHGDVFLLQSAVMAWEDWNLDFVPRFGGREFARVRETIHDVGARFIVYTSPFFFLRGTELESYAFNSFESFKGWPGVGTGTGENMELFMEAITRVMEEHRPDGLYFDWQYHLNPAALYALARRSRALVGDDGILEWHSTGALGYGRCYFPQADAYADIILRGEDQTRMYSDFRYLRFFVSGYNINNCIGVLCNNLAGGDPTTELTRELLRANCRYHTIATWIDDPAIMEVLGNHYRPRLTPGLRTLVDRGVDERQRRLPAEARARQAELRALDRPPDWGAPVLSVGFAELPEAEAVFSPHNEDPFAIIDGALHIRALAHTYAFLRVPLAGKAEGVLLRLRQGTDGGMAWGPSALLRWPGGAILRLGTRSDGIIQIDSVGGLALKGSHDAREWTWLRARWGPVWAVVEQSADGERFERVWAYRHGGAFLEETSDLLIGKTYHDGGPHDYSIPGELGECDIDFVRVYGDG